MGPPRRSARGALLPIAVGLSLAAAPAARASGAQPSAPRGEEDVKAEPEALMEEGWPLPAEGFGEDFASPHTRRPLMRRAQGSGGGRLEPEAPAISSEGILSEAGPARSLVPIPILAEHSAVESGRRRGGPSPSPPASTGTDSTKMVQVSIVLVVRDVNFQLLVGDIQTYYAVEEALKKIVEEDGGDGMQAAGPLSLIFKDHARGGIWVDCSFTVPAGVIADSVQASLRKSNIKTEATAALRDLPGLKKLGSTKVKVYRGEVKVQPAVPVVATTTATAAPTTTTKAATTTTTAVGATTTVTASSTTKPASSTTKTAGATVASGAPSPPPPQPKTVAAAAASTTTVPPKATTTQAASVNATAPQACVKAKDADFYEGIHFALLIVASFLGFIVLPATCMYFLCGPQQVGSARFPKMKAPGDGKALAADLASGGGAMPSAEGAPPAASSGAAPAASPPPPQAGHDAM